jgi:hypothetical protein
MRLVDGTELCHCGQRRGLHRYGDECCPNPRWKCGNGEPQWWAHRRFTASFGVHENPTNGACNGIFDVLRSAVRT